MGSRNIGPTLSLDAQLRWGSWRLGVGRHAVDLARERHERHRRALRVLGHHEPDSLERPAERHPLVDAGLERLVGDDRQLDELVLERHYFASSLAAAGA